MNNEFFKGIETARAVGRLDVFRLDGASPQIAISPRLLRSAVKCMMQSELAMVSDTSSIKRVLGRMWKSFPSMVWSTLRKKEIEHSLINWVCHATRN